MSRWRRRRCTRRKDEDEEEEAEAEEKGGWWRWCADFWGGRCPPIDPLGSCHPFFSSLRSASLCSLPVFSPLLVLAPGQRPTFVRAQEKKARSHGVRSETERKRGRDATRASCVERVAWRARGRLCRRERESLPRGTTNARVELACTCTRPDIHAHRRPHAGTS